MILHFIVGVSLAGFLLGLVSGFNMDMFSFFQFCMDPGVDVTGHLGFDTALVSVFSPFDVSLWTQSTSCWKCPGVQQISHRRTAKIKLDTRFPQVFTVADSASNKSLCASHSQHHLVDQGTYTLNISNTSCIWTLTNNPVNSDLAVYIALSVLFGVFFLWLSLKSLYRRGFFSRFCFRVQERDVISDLDSSLVPDESITFAPNLQPTNRIQSIDTFRGLSLVIMIFVNYGGGNYWYFQHSAWNGLTVADLVFPWFVFLMGTSIAISFPSALRRGYARKTLLIRVVRRFCILFFLGLMLSNNGSDVSVSSLRIFGVLQRLALTYLVVAATEAYCAIPADPHVHKWWRGVRELVPSLPVWLLAFFVTLLHLCLTFGLQVPGCPRGYLGPGGLHDGGQFENCTGGVAGYIDRIILTPNHMYKHPTCQSVYHCKQYDPEGILGSLMSILMCILGLQAGKIVITYQSPKGILRRWSVWIIITGIAAGVLCEFKLEDGWIPVNKNLWSLSYVLAMSSLAFFLLSMFYITIDVYNLWNGAPFIYPGMNSIVIYLCHEIFETYFPIEFHVPRTHAAYLCKNIWGTAVWVCVAGYMYRKNLFIAI